MDIANPELQLADDFVRQTNCHIFLTGRAGTGKTTFLHALRKKTGKRMVVTAPTGVAAINAGGVTLHSFFQLPFGPFIPGDTNYLGRHRFSREKINIVKTLDLLVIDEISMVRADLLDGVDCVLRRYRHNGLPFGGVQLLMIGDLYQLPPVVKGAEWQVLRQYYDSPYFFASRALRETELIPIELRHIYRQSDARFIDLLNRVRDNRLDPASLQQLNSRCIPDFTPADNEGYITLCTHNSGADAINQGKLQQLQSTSYQFRAGIEGDFPEHSYPTSARLELRVGAQVMFVRNDASPDKRYFNGRIGRITAIFNDSIRVRCPEDSGDIEVEQATWDNIEYRIDPETLEISQNKIGSFAQFPLKLAWAITIHKSQGLTFERAIVDAGAAFAQGQVYVALSRCKTFAGLVLSSPLSAVGVKTDAAVSRFVEEAGRNQPSPEKLAAARVSYQQQLLTGCFDFSYLRSRLGRLVALLMKNRAVLQVSGAGEIGDLERRCRDEITAVGENFQKQLHGMFRADTLPEADPAILERTVKASAYFEDRIVSLLVPCVANLRIDTDNKEIGRKVRDAVKQLGEETAVKLAAVRSCHSGFSPAAYLRAVSAAEIELKPAKDKQTPAATYGESDIAHPALFQSLKDWRARKAGEEGVPHFQIMHQKTLVQIAVNLPESLAALRRIKGIGPRLAEKFGGELVDLVADYRREHGIAEVVLPVAPDAEAAGTTRKTAAKGDTRRISLEMFENRLSVTDIAKQRGLVVATVEGHLAHFVEQGILAVDRLITTDRRLAIEQQLAGTGGSLGAVRQALGEDYSYGEIKIVQAHLKHLATVGDGPSA
ncbi:MAG: helix-turn-helix domain-containing protein [Desulfoprunum sp.]|jgi:hypothetical protein|uniref:helix-turn-helix domain-containing protein n=1 Tax=Desulfoprunum sp. TaxID=2020866 RepID=UPI00052BF5FE|nr:helicase [Desulfobulbus sp. Tol-SR]